MLADCELAARHLDFYHKPVGKCPTKWAGLPLKYEHLPSNMSTGTKPPGKTALHQVYLLSNV